MAKYVIDVYEHDELRFVAGPYDSPEDAEATSGPIQHGRVSESGWQAKLRRCDDDRA